jgi:hypothetical protein
MSWNITPCSPFDVNRRFGFASYFEAGFLLLLFFDPKDGVDMFLRKVGWFSADCMALLPRKNILRYPETGFWTNIGSPEALN